MTKTLIALALASVCALPAHAIDFGKLLSTENINKAVELAKNTADANKELTPEQEAAIGDEAAAKLLGAKPLVNNSNLQRYVNQVGMWLALQSGKPALPWHFGVIEDPTVNSFATPGGNIVITRGLWDRISNEAELAAVLSHEITHVVKQHHLRAMKGEASRKALANLADLAVSAKGGGDKQKLIGNLGKGASEIAVRGLDKGDEYEADVFAMVLLARAGYNPYAMVSVLQMLERFNANSGGLEVFNTHSDPGARQDVIEASVGEQLEPYAGGVQQTQRFIAVKQGKSPGGTPSKGQGKKSGK
ncbi:M48 family metalloprotease [Chitinilyticum litopenaei]|uniref:M48 family metalloprotease n=1 Tax=Chitinilyticum litopenaei TaxID=1121276 RepID=UPI0004253461|nr:M48 family metalloprotease [Chitinilyticum litopenaei]